MIRNRCSLACICRINLPIKFRKNCVLTQKDKNLVEFFKIILKQNFYYRRIKQKQLFKMISKTLLLKKRMLKMLNAKNLQEK